MELKAVSISGLACLLTMYETQSSDAKLKLENASRKIAELYDEAFSRDIPLCDLYPEEREEQQ